MENIGNETIDLEPIEFCSNPPGCIPPETLVKGESAGHGPFRDDIQKKITIKWKVLETGKVYTQEIAVKLPNGFYNPEWTSDIIFYINPNREKAWIVYKIFDENEDNYVIVDSEGKPFPIDDYADDEE